MGTLRSARRRRARVSTGLLGASSATARVELEVLLVSGVIRKVVESAVAVSGCTVCSAVARGRVALARLLTVVASRAARVVGSRAGGVSTSTDLDFSEKRSAGLADTAAPAQRVKGGGKQGRVMKQVEEKVQE